MTSAVVWLFRFAHGTRVRFYPILLSFVLGSASQADQSADWIKLWNEAEFRLDVLKLEEAYRASDPATYISISKYVLGASIVPRADWEHPFGNERQYMAFALAAKYLNQFQQTRTDDDLTAFLVSVRRLAQVTGGDAWLATKLMIARARELESYKAWGKYDFDIAYFKDFGGIPIPNGADEWLFYMSGGPAITDVSTAYEREWASSNRKPNLLAGVCVIFNFLCTATIKTKNHTQISNLRHPITLNVRINGLDIDYTRLNELVIFEQEKMRRFQQE